MKKLLLHSCCGPCSTAVIERLAEEGYDICVFYFNPNITEEDEYDHRRSEQERFIKEYNEAFGKDIKYIEGSWDPDEYLCAVKGHEADSEGGERCSICFVLRMEETAKKAEELGFDCFDTTLTVSPHKNYDIISGIGLQLQYKYGVEYLSGNYKKKDGFKRSTQLSKEYGLYRQDFCGCRFSRRTE